ncbi:MAG: hypothetical protein M1828_006982 [Chrysothrix sp. TS-e1954]|nr:MAG: hypothetical protein M1828_006982 [Chrysothrix sp. TS-e1954]
MAVLEVRSIPPFQIDEASKLSLTAFRDYPVYQVVFPNSDSPATIHHEATRIREESAEEAKNPPPKKWHLCVVDTASPEDRREILSYANYYIHFPDPETPEPKPGSQEITSAGRTAPSDANMEAWNFLVPNAIAGRKAAMGDEQTYLYLATLCTGEAARRRGCGTLVLDWGKAKAKELGIPFVLQASPDGVSLYTKNGFKPIGELRKDLSKWGGPVESVDVIMRWDS